MQRKWFGSSKSLNEHASCAMTSRSKKQARFAFFNPPLFIWFGPGCALLVIFVFLFLVVTSAVQATEYRKPQKWAILIGIGQYSNLPPLQGPLNDVEIIAYVLHNRFGFEKEQILTLQNESATRKDIFQTFETVLAKVSSSDIVYIHFSGHGSQVKDFDGDEQDDHMDETIVPYDGRTVGVPDITDDELRQVFNRIRARRLIVTIDACHSGSATRGVSIQTRSVPADSRIELYGRTQSQTRGYRNINPPHVVSLSSSAPLERSLDGPVGGRYHGYFSYAVFRSLFTSPMHATPQVIFEGVKNELVNIKTALHRRTFPAPQLEVPENLREEPLLTIPASNTKPETDWHLGSDAGGRVIVTLLENNQVKLEPARYLGGLPGSVWEIIPSGQFTSTYQNEKIFAVVQSVTGMNAIAEVIGDRNIFFQHAEARLVQPASPPNRFSIIIRDLYKALSSTHREIIRLFQPFVGKPQDQQGENFVVDIREKEVAISSADGLEPVNSISIDNFENFPERLNSIFVEANRIATFRGLHNPGSTLMVKGRLKNFMHDEGESQAILFDPLYFPRARHESSQARNSLQVEVWVNKPSFLTILDVDSDGNRKVLFPSPFQRKSFYPKGFIPANTNIVLPDSLSEPNEAGFVWDIGEPFGRDTLFIFASTDEETAETVRQFGRERNYVRASPSRGVYMHICSPYQQLRNHLFSGIHPDGKLKGCSRGRIRGSSDPFLRENGKTEPIRDSSLPKDWNALSLNFWIDAPY